MDQFLHRQLTESGLTIITFGNFIPSWILGNSVCMSIWWERNIYISIRNTPYQFWTSGVIVLEDPTSLSGQLYWVWIKQSHFTTCKVTPKFWIQVSQCKIIFKYIRWTWNFREFIRFFQKGLNPLKIQEKIQSGVSFQFYNLNSVANWKWTQWEKLFRMINSSTMRSLNIFGHRYCLRSIF
jgi:hypothetical protein